MFGEQEVKEQLPEETVDIDAYNDMQMKYQRHLVQIQDEQNNAQEGLKKLAAEYRADWKSCADKEAQKAIEDANKQWADMQNMISDEKVNSWTKIGSLAGDGQGRAFEVLRLKVQDEAKKEEAEKAEKAAEEAKKEDASKEESK